jgi:hypothetical protein
MLGVVRVACVLGSSLVVAVACGSSDGNTHPRTEPDGGDSPQTMEPPADADDFFRAYARAVCRMYEPCCKAEQLGYDADGCIDWYAKVVGAYFSRAGAYHTDRGQSCLDAVNAAIDADAERCDAVPSFEEATFYVQCGGAFGEPVKGSKAGEGPCGPGNAHAISCRGDLGLYCDRASDVCAPRVGAGELCPYPGACDAESQCVGGTCQGLPGPGERCLNAIQGAGGFCRPGSACDVQTLICGDALALGASCREPAQCATRQCSGGKCGDKEFTKSMNCTG